MEFRLRRGGDALRVALGSDGDALAAAVDGDPHRVDAVAAGTRTAVAGATVEEIAFTLDGRPCRALVARLRDRVLVALRGRVYAFELGDEAGGAHAAAGSGAVTAPMPGKVASVLVAVSDAVTVGQPRRARGDEDGEHARRRGRRARERGARSPAARSRPAISSSRSHPPPSSGAYSARKLRRPWRRHRARRTVACPPRRSTRCAS
jgi:biotin carboxyl carrier protein